jgi:AAA domain
MNRDWNEACDALDCMSDETTPPPPARHTGSKPKLQVLEGAKSTGLRLTLYDEIETEPRKDWLVANLLGAGELSCIAAAPGTAKSAIALDAGAHIAAGLDWFEHRVTPCGVLYVAGERSALVKRRLAAWRNYRKINGLALGIVSGSVDFRTSAASVLAIIDLAKRLANAKEIEVGHIIIDTTNRCLAGGDENSSKDMGALLCSVERLQVTGAHVQLIHHIPADGQQRPRGHGSLLAACDTTFRIEQVGSVRSLVMDKSNDGEEGQRVSFTLKSIELHRDPETGLVTTAPVVVPALDPPVITANSAKLTPNQATMLSILQAAKRPLSIEEWNERAREAGIGTKRKADLYDCREALLRKGLIYQGGNGWCAKP